MTEGQRQAILDLCDLVKEVMCHECEMGFGCRHCYRRDMFLDVREKLSNEFKVGEAE